MLTNFVALTAGLATTASAFTCTGNYFSFFNRGGDTLDYARIDPSVYPGVISPHLHSFDGGSGLGAKTTFNDLMGSDCTTARVKQDKSLYWRPSLFFKNSTGFYRVPEQNTKIYYKYGDGDKWANVTGFPEEFSMLAGHPNKRSEGNNEAGVRWGCHQPDGRDDKIFADSFPKGFQSCAYGFASEVTFPSCWNGKEVDPVDPHAHMAYPSGYGGVGIENCPTSHRAARFPTIFVEFWYDISSFDGQYDANTSPWVLSTGDETGYGFHGDFMNGWEKGVLEKATAESGGCNCGCGCGQTEIEQCFGAENVNKNDDEVFKSCKAMKPSVGQDFATTMEKLPGCNALTSGPEDAVMIDCGANGAPIAGGNADVPAVSKTHVVSYAASSAMASEAAPSSASKDFAEASSVASFHIKNPVNPTAASDMYGEPTLSLRTPAGSETPRPTPAASEGYRAPASSVDAPPAGSETVKASPAASEDYSSYYGAVPTPSAGEPASPPENNLPSLTLSSGGKPTGTPAGEESCKEPIYVTVTPTIYVTAGAVSNTTTPCVPTITQTVKDTVTVTVPAMGGVQYGSY